MKLSFRNFQLIILTLFCSCSPAEKKLAKPPFYIKLPPGWIVKEEQGIDSEVGIIEGPGVRLYYDRSGMGYADSLVQSETTFIHREKYNRPCGLRDTGVTYISSLNTKQAIAEEMKRRNIKDASLIRIEPDPLFFAKEHIRKPTKDEQRRFPKADKMLDLSYGNKLVSIDIELPPKIKEQVVTTDTTKNFIIRTTWPKVTGKGITGVYIKSRSSALNFNISGKSLSAQQQDEALKAFKTIKLN